MAGQRSMHAGEAGARSLVASPVGVAAIIFLLVFLACLAGIATRPLGLLADFWPANAILLGTMLRIPAAASLPGWVAAGCAYMAADLLTGSPVLKALILNAANLVGVASAFWAFRGLAGSMLRIGQAGLVFRIAVASAVGGAAAGIVGAIANPYLFGGGIVTGFTFWFASEFVNHFAIVPVILTAPAAGSAARYRRLLLANDPLPFLSLVASCLAAWAIGGPGAIAFPVPALLWCGITYPLFTTAVLTLLIGLWTMFVIGTGPMRIVDGQIDTMRLVSVRLGASLIALAPLVLAAVMQSRNELLARLNHLVAHDPLTGIMSRSAFLEGAQACLGPARPPCAILMVDLDNFKSVNDSYGHAGGDQVLVAFAARGRAALRPGDLFGRLGGEEFAACLIGCTPAEALQLAEGLRLAIDESPVALADGRLVRATVSIGVAFSDSADPRRIDDLLARADGALYDAKRAGRNRVQNSYLELLPAQDPDRPGQSRTEAPLRKASRRRLGPRSASSRV